MTITTSHINSKVCQKNGYTQIVEAILEHENIEVRLNTSFSESMKAEFDHIFWSGPLDAYFGFELGRLGYRTLDFEAFRDEGDFQGNAVINYGDEKYPILVFQNINTLHHGNNTRKQFVIVNSVVCVVKMIFRITRFV